MEAIMTTSNPTQAPGCYGAASVFSLDSGVCQACPVYEACGEAAHKTLEAIRGVIDVSDVLARHAQARLKAQQAAAAKKRPASVESNQAVAFAPQLQQAQPQPITTPVARHTPVRSTNFEISPEDRQRIAALSNNNAQQLAESLGKKGLLHTLRPELMEGRNPFRDVDVFPFLRVTCDMLLEGGLTKASLAQRMQKECGKDKPWTAATAESHRAITLVMFGGFGLLEKEGEVYRLKRQEKP